MNIYRVLIPAFIILFSACSFAQVGNPAPDFTVTDVHGKKHRLYDYLDQGKSVVLDFFFTTCIPCQFYAPQANKAYEKYGCNTQDVIFLSIDYNDTDAQVIEYENTYDIKFPSASGKQGGGNAVVSLYKIQAFPTFLLIDSTKTIADQIDPPTLIVFDFKFAQHSLSPKACLTSIDQLDSQDNISLYPNPSNSVIRLLIKNPFSSNSLFKIYDTFGRLAYSSCIPSQTSEMHLNISTLPPGLYFYSIDQRSMPGKLLIVD